MLDGCHLLRSNVHRAASGCMDLMVCSISQLPLLLTLGWFISKTNFLFDHNSQFKEVWQTKFWSKQQQDRISALHNLFNKFSLQHALSSFQQQHSLYGCVWPWIPPLLLISWSSLRPSCEWWLVWLRGPGHSWGLKQQPDQTAREGLGLECSWPRD